ncbi:TPA: hypothetical protein IAA92_06605 [Candidatus Galligastranaerophilus intestinigallinarum]|nr:hypothetical protein [Candidatus Galligastranaerophilus intestinigallinarum]
MYLEYRVDNDELQDAWLQTLLNMVDELSCKYQMFFEEGYSTKKKCFTQTRIIKVTGPDAVLGWLKLRMERYNHFISMLNNYAEFYISKTEEEN